jgi:hypothetical protein
MQKGSRRTAGPLLLVGGRIITGDIRRATYGGRYEKTHRFSRLTPPVVCRPYYVARITSFAYSANAAPFSMAWPLSALATCACWPTGTRTAMRRFGGVCPRR